MEILYIILSGVLHAIRGIDKVSRTVFIILNFNLIYFLICDDWRFGVIASLGILLWLMKGWGKYFMAETGNVATYQEDEVKIVDYLTDKILGEPKTEREARNWGTLAMSIRGSLFSIPLFVALGYYLGNPYAVLFSIPMLVQGIYYRSIVFHRSYRVAEFLTAATYSSSILMLHTIG